jgi:hypothetical protein
MVRPPAYPCSERSPRSSVDPAQRSRNPEPNATWHGAGPKATHTAHFPGGVGSQGAPGGESPKSSRVYQLSPADASGAGSGDRTGTMTLRKKAGARGTLGDFQSSPRQPAYLAGGLPPCRALRERAFLAPVFGFGAGDEIRTRDNLLGTPHRPVTFVGIPKALIALVSRGRRVREARRARLGLCG